MLTFYFEKYIFLKILDMKDNISMIQSLVYKCTRICSYEIFSLNLGTRRGGATMFVCRVGLHV